MSRGVQCVEGECNVICGRVQCVSRGSAVCVEGSAVYVCVCVVCVVWMCGVYGIWQVWE